MLSLFRISHMWLLWGHKSSVRKDLPHPREWWARSLVKHQESGIRFGNRPPMNWWAMASLKSNWLVIDKLALQQRACLVTDRQSSLREICYIYWLKAREIYHTSRPHLLTSSFTVGSPLPSPYCHLQLHLVQVSLCDISFMLYLLLESICFENECAQQHSVFRVL